MTTPTIDWINAATGEHSCVPGLRMAADLMQSYREPQYESCIKQAITCLADARAEILRLREELAATADDQDNGYASTKNQLSKAANEAHDEARVSKEQVEYLVKENEKLRSNAKTLALCLQLEKATVETLCQHFREGELARDYAAMQSALADALDWYHRGIRGEVSESASWASMRCVVERALERSHLPDGHEAKV